jgi:hypothetical protein
MSSPSDLYLVEVTIPMVVRAVSIDDARDAALRFYGDQWGDAAEEARLARAGEPRRIEPISKHVVVDLLDLHPYASDTWYTAHGYADEDEYDQVLTVREIINELEKQ